MVTGRNPLTGHAVNTPGPSSSTSARCRQTDACLCADCYMRKFGTLPPLDDPRLRGLADRISAAADEYDAHLIHLAASAAACQSADDMRAWLFERGDGASARADDDTVTAAFLDRLKAITAELTRWIERLTAPPEVDR